MQHLIKPSFLKYAFLLLLVNLTRAISWAQDSTMKTTSTTTSSSTSVEQNWYAQPWVWVVGGAVFILVIVALVRGNSGTTDKVTITKTRSSE